MCVSPHDGVNVSGPSRRIPGHTEPLAGAPGAGVCLLSGGHRAMAAPGSLTPDIGGEWALVTRHGHRPSVQIIQCLSVNVFVKMFGTMSFRVNTVSLLLLNSLTTTHCLHIKSINVPKYAKVSHYNIRSYYIRDKSKKKI